MACSYQVLLLAFLALCDAADFQIQPENVSSAAPVSSVTFVEPMKNYSKVVGDSLKIRCVVKGEPPVTRFKWFKNEAPLEEERGRIRIRSKTGGNYG